MSWSGRSASVFALLGLASAGACATGTPPRTDSSRVTHLLEPGGTAVAVAVILPGSAGEDPARGGLHLLTARTLLEQARPALEALGASASVACERAAFTFTLLSAPEEWHTAVGLFLDAIFRPDPGEAALRRARSDLTAALALDQANPAWQARLAARQALHAGDEGDAAWARPPCGVPELLPRFTLADVRQTAGSFRPDQAWAAVVGPVGDAAFLRRAVGAGPGVALPAPAALHPGRRYVERNTVTAWIALAFPFALGTDVDAARLLAAVIEDAFAPGIDRPDVFAASYEVERHGSGGSVILYLVTAPEAAARYAHDVLAAVERITAEGVHPAVHARVLRPHRGERLLARSAPEARAAALARALAFGQEPEPWPHPERITPDALRAVASMLGPAAVAVVGPRAARNAVVEDSVPRP